MFVELCTLLLPCAALMVVFLSRQQLPKRFRSIDFDTEAPRPTASTARIDYSAYDYIVLDNLYAAALLARCGYAVLSIQADSPYEPADLAFGFDTLQHVSRRAKYMLEALGCDLYFQREDAGQQIPEELVRPLAEWQRRAELAQIESRRRPFVPRSLRRFFLEERSTAGQVAEQCTEQYAAELLELVGAEPEELFHRAARRHRRLQQRYRPVSDNERLSPSAYINLALAELIGSAGGLCVYNTEATVAAEHLVLPDATVSLEHVTVIYEENPQRELVQRTWLGLRGSPQRNMFSSPVLETDAAQLHFITDPNYKRRFPNKSACVVDVVNTTGEEAALEAFRTFSDARILYKHTEQVALKNFEDELETGAVMAMKALDYSFVDVVLRKRNIVDELYAMIYE